MKTKKEKGKNREEKQARVIMAIVSYRHCAVMYKYFAEGRRGMEKDILSPGLPFSLSPSPPPLPSSVDPHLQSSHPPPQSFWSILTYQHPFHSFCLFAYSLICLFTSISPPTSSYTLPPGFSLLFKYFFSTFGTLQYWKP